jgi:hypothetical protein
MNATIMPKKKITIVVNTDGTANVTVDGQPHVDLASLSTLDPNIQNLKTSYQTAITELENTPSGKLQTLKGKLLKLQQLCNNFKFDTNIMIGNVPYNMTKINATVSTIKTVSEEIKQTGVAVAAIFSLSDDDDKKSAATHATTAANTVATEAAKVAAEAAEAAKATVTDKKKAEAEPKADEVRKIGTSTVSAPPIAEPLTVKNIADALVFVDTAIRKFPIPGGFRKKTRHRRNRKARRTISRRH